MYLFNCVQVSYGYIHIYILGRRAEQSIYTEVKDHWTHYVNAEAAKIQKQTVVSLFFKIYQPFLFSC